MKEAAYLAQKEKLLRMNIMEFFTIERLNEEDTQQASQIHESLKGAVLKLQTYAMDSIADLTRYYSIDRLCKIPGIDREKADIIERTLRHSGLSFAG